MQDPAPKCLVLFLDLPGHDAEQDLHTLSLPNLDAVARDGRTGHLALRKDAGSRPAPKLSALAQLLDMHKVGTFGLLRSYTYVSTVARLIIAYICHAGILEHPGRWYRAEWAMAVIV